MKTSDKNLDSTVVENVKLGKATLVDNKLLGEWTVHLSCDGSIMCYACPKISFRTDGFSSVTNGMGTVQNLKWEMKGGKIKISSFTTHSIVDNGEYAMTYQIDKEFIQLKLINSVNSDCYKFTRVTSS